MGNDDDETIKYYNSSVNKEKIGNNLDSIDSRGNNSGLGENGNTIEGGSQLKENPEKFLLTHNAPTYGLELENCTKNAIMIFNQENFRSPLRKRKGSWIDVINLKQTFEPFRFEVVTCEDSSKADLLEALKRFLWKRDFRAYGCVCVALLTHGQEGLLEASDRSFPESDFFECFDVRMNETLAGKPIIILVQACRGTEVTDNVKVELAMAGNEDNQKPRFMYLPTFANMLVFHSCYTNTASNRYPERGSLFIGSLCHQIRESPGQDFESICLQVKREVAVKFDEFQDNQMPVVTSTLLRKLYLKDPEPKAGLLQNDQNPLRMPPTYFLQYFKYIKKCLRLYIKRKADFSVAIPQDMLDQVEKHENAPSIGNVQLDFIKEAYWYLKYCSKDNSDYFPEFDLVYFHYLSEGF